METLKGTIWVCEEDLYYAKPKLKKAFSKGKHYMQLSDANKSKHIKVVDDCGKNHVLGRWSIHFTILEQTKTIKENGNLFVSDNTITTFEITPFDQDGECYFIMRDPVDGDNYHSVDKNKAKEIIAFLQEGLNKIK